ncbi:MAG TPA: hypothetical protein VGS57_03700 [Thermoanaerobaculia bacterium]|nr:hypothetical protein [Thermoanaerobaculia bacterium]
MESQWVTRNHYNPCFWTAYWNPDYYAAAVAGTTPLPAARDQVVYSLNVKGDRIFPTTVANVHYEKDFGPAELSRDDAEAFVKRHYPDRFQSDRQAHESAHYPVFINFEQILTALEGMEHYDHLRTVIARGTLGSPMEKGMIACLVHLQALRSHGIMNSLVEWYGTLGVKKFEFFMLLKWALSNIDCLAEAIAPLALSHWVLYRTESDTFPLTDSPVLILPNSVMWALSPRLLLEIHRGRAAPESQWQTKNGIKRGKLAEFRRRTIGNTFREIIFSDRRTLEFWQSTKEFRQRTALMAETSSYNRLIHRSAERELWEVNAWGNQ